MNTSIFCISDNLQCKETYFDRRSKEATFYCTSSNLQCSQGIPVPLYLPYLTPFDVLLIFIALIIQLVRRLQNQDENIAEDESSATPKKIFQILNQVLNLSGFEKICIKFLNIMFRLQLIVVR